MQNFRARSTNVLGSHKHHATFANKKYQAKSAFLKVKTKLLRLLILWSNSEKQKMSCVKVGALGHYYLQKLELPWKIL